MERKPCKGPFINYVVSRVEGPILLSKKTTKRGGGKGSKIANDIVYGWPPTKVTKIPKDENME